MKKKSETRLNQPHLGQHSTCSVPIATREYIVVDDFLAIYHSYTWGISRVVHFVSQKKVAKYLGYRHYTWGVAILWGGGEEGQRFG